MISRHEYMFRARNDSAIVPTSPILNTHTFKTHIYSMKGIITYPEIEL
jgi:hypothetical protein